MLNYATAEYARVNDFRRELRALGYVEGQSLIIAHRWADGQSERLPQLAAELASGNDVIIALGPAHETRDRRPQQLSHRRHPPRRAEVRAFCRGRDDVPATLALALIS